MILTSENTTAENGTPIHSRLSLDIDLVGIEKRPFRVDVSVGGNRLYTSHHVSRADAEKSRATMHQSYMEVHSRAA